MLPSTHSVDLWSILIRSARECEVLHTRMRRRLDPKKMDAQSERPQRPTVTLDVPADVGRVPSRKYGRTAADLLPQPRCDMRCPDEPQLEEGEGHEQDGHSSDIAPALYQQLGLGGRARRELCRHLRHSPGKLEELDGVVASAGPEYLCRIMNLLQPRPYF